jgi:iron complex outermembrane recepter protein
MREYCMKKLLFTTTALALIAPMTAFAADAPAPAADAPPVDAPQATDIIVTGTRTTGTRAADSSAPIELVGSSAIANVGQQDLTQVLAQSLPSLNFRAFGGDTANLTMSAALRGISPNDTLVLINGKRRHTTANLSVLSGSPYTGSAAVDLSYVPTNTIGHIEVLQDGAAAQYGSDAIAGVVNIMLKNADHGGSVTMTGGQNYAGDGDQFGVAGNIGLKLPGDGFLNITSEYKFHGFSQRGTCDYRFSNPDCTQASALHGNAAGQDYNRVEAGVNAAAGTPDVNKINGDARYTLWNTFFNAGSHLTDNVEAYAFGNVGVRRTRSYENYRTSDVVSGTTSTGDTVYPIAQGFSPQEAMRETDYSVTGGLKGDLSGWNWDLSTTYGRDLVALYTFNSANSELYSEAQANSATVINPQRNFYDGKLTNSEWAANLDLTKDVEVGFAKPLTVAWGAEFRSDSYNIESGEYSSYTDGGAQSYPGFSPQAAGENSRQSEALYLDLATDPVTNLHVDVAGRYEHYSEFGSVGSGKFNARYDFSPAFALRGTFSNGFRAPTLAEEYYTSVNVGPGTAFGQFPSDSAASTSLGFGKLKPEKSLNFSVGMVAHPLPKVQLTVDAYQINIKNRIVNTTAFATYGTNADGSLHVVSQAVYNALQSRGVNLSDASSYSGINIFTNGANTRTRGVEATANYTSDFGDYGKVDWSLAANWNQTSVTNVRDLPSQVLSAYSTELMTQNGISALTTATPRIKTILGGLWTYHRLTVNFRETFYGSTSQWTSLDGTGDVGTTGRDLEHIGFTGISDLDIGYKLTPTIRLDIGANNLFNVKAPTVANTTVNGLVRPTDGSKVFSAPMSFTPWGIDGGYYYAKATFTF